MKTPALRDHEEEPARLDRPQPLGFLPTLAFWKRPDVGKIVGPWLGTFVFFWLMIFGMFVVQWTPIWLSALLGGVGPFLFIAVLEHHLRARLRHRALGAKPLADSLPPAGGHGEAATPHTREDA